MHVLFISQCSGKAITETQRILDQFAERKGDRTWQTPITMIGVQTARQMLRKTARKNTAVACHWIKSGDRTELLWIVGKLSAFNEDGTVPTNTSGRDILRTASEHTWQTSESIALLAGLAGLFHDFGKSNALFQKKLSGKGTRNFEPYRHEWISLRLFQAFVGKKTDGEWLSDLEKGNLDDLEDMLFSELRPYTDEKKDYSPFNLVEGISQPLARSVGWLILSHHRLPVCPASNREDRETNLPSVDSIDSWFNRYLKPDWNSPRKNVVWESQEEKEQWLFPKGTPFRSSTWRKKAGKIAQRALRHQQLFERSWLEERLPIHLARLALMIADHTYSAAEPRIQNQDPRYKVFANTDRKTKQVKQRLDEHNIGVCNTAILSATALPFLRGRLPAVDRHKVLRKRTSHPDFVWQNRAYELALGLSELTEENGFFGINMASTGSGKTFANARIMYGLAGEKKRGCRFSVALGLRTLTLQTGDAFKERLGFDSDSLAVLIGSQAVRDLHEERLREKEKKTFEEVEASGTESGLDLIPEHQYVQYEGYVAHDVLGKFIDGHDKNANQKVKELLSAPVLVCTIDQLIGATEGLRGGKQLAPMLRLLTSDLVLDEPDDFGLEDLHALCRLVNWAGLLGNRVLLSSATLPPDLVVALFEAYAAGRKQYTIHCREQKDHGKPVICAWFDELQAPCYSNHSDPRSFFISHSEFVEQRAGLVRQKPAQRRGKIVSLPEGVFEKRQAVEEMARTVAQEIQSLHEQHFELVPTTNQKVSFGLVRFANIRPLVAVAQQFVKIPPPPGFKICFCIYHSQFPLIVRSKIEEALDETLNRKEPNIVWKNKVVHEHLKGASQENVVFVVFATPVAEVGRDHDYDWAIVEPSSLRSIIQLAGRVKRHRPGAVTEPNVSILSRNFRSLRGEKIVFRRPGFQTAADILASQCLHDLLSQDEYEHITSAPRITKPSEILPSNSLRDLEHCSLHRVLFEDRVAASLWWNKEVTWSGELQRRKRFRKSDQKVSYMLLKKDEEPAKFATITPDGKVVEVETSRFRRVESDCVANVEPWLSVDLDQTLEQFAEARDEDLMGVSMKYAEISLREKSSSAEKWVYDQVFGVYEEV